MLNVLGDSLVIINWENGIVSLSPPDLHHWCRDIRKLSSCFHELYFCHIYHEYNQLANRLSKRALTLAPGTGEYSEFFEVVSQDMIELF